MKENVIQRRIIKVDVTKTGPASHTWCIDGYKVHGLGFSVNFTSNNLEQDSRVIDLVSMVPQKKLY